MNFDLNKSADPVAVWVPPGCCCQPGDDLHVLTHVHTAVGYIMYPTILTPCRPAKSTAYMYSENSLSTAGWQTPQMSQRAAHSAIVAE